MISGDRTPSADAVFAKDSEWTAPLLWRSEFRSVLALYLKQRFLTLDDASTIFRKAEDLLGGNERQVESEAVLQIAEQSGCSAYDAEFVYVAQYLGLPLVTSDQKLLRAFSGSAVSPEEFAQ